MLPQLPNISPGASSPAVIAGRRRWSQVKRNSIRGALRVRDLLPPFYPTREAAPPSFPSRASHAREAAFAPNPGGRAPVRPRTPSNSSLQSQTCLDPRETADRPCHTRVELPQSSGPTSPKEGVRLVSAEFESFHQSLHRSRRVRLLRV